MAARQLNIANNVSPTAVNPVQRTVWAKHSRHGQLVTVIFFAEPKPIIYCSSVSVGYKPDALGRYVRCGQSLGPHWKRLKGVIGRLNTLSGDLVQKAYWRVRRLPMRLARYGRNSPTLRRQPAFLRHAQPEYHVNRRRHTSILVVLDIDAGRLLLKALGGALCVRWCRQK